MMGRIVDFLDIVFGLVFLGGIVAVSGGLALLSLNLLFHTGFSYAWLLVGGVLAIAVPRVLGNFMHGGESVIAEQVKAKVCQYCGKVPSNNVKCDFCGANPGLGGETV